MGVEECKKCFGTGHVHYLEQGTDEKKSGWCSECDGKGVVIDGQDRGK